jgi:hypothetical protein
MQSDQDDDRRCFIDGDDGSEGCVLDENDLDGCDMAANLHADGRCKTDCPHWRYPDAVAESRKSDAHRVEVRILIRTDAAKMREEKLQRDTQDILDMAASAPDHQESSGQGCYCPPERNSDSEQFTH